MTAPPRSVLVVDDEPGMRTALQASFLRHGWTVKTATGIRDASTAIERGNFDLVLSDVRMRDGDGFDIMRLVRHHLPSAAVILLTAFGSVPEAVKSMRSGAFDYLTKPVSFDQLQATAARVLERASQAPEPAQAVPFTTQISGRSPALLQALQRARAAASTSADILIEAENGSGKKTLARYIHEHSSRSAAPFLSARCALLTVSNLTTNFLLADSGTLLLDEVGEIPTTLQPALLRILQDREITCPDSGTVYLNLRVIATSSIPLATLVDEGHFRSDLYYRLNVIPLTLPTIRDRLEMPPAPILPTPGVTIAQLERTHLENTLALARGNRTHAAEMLGISLRTVRNKIKEYGLPPRTYTERPSA